MTKQTIEVEGLPEECEAVAVQFEPNYFNKYTGDDGFIYFEAKVKVKKIQPRRIVLEETSDYNEQYYSGLYETQVFSNGLRLRNQKHVWREVKETDIPLTKEEHKLSLTKKDILELIEHIKLGGQLNPKIAEFIKVNS